MRSININRCLTIIDRINSILLKYSNIKATYYLKHSNRTKTYTVCFETRTEISELIESGNTHEILVYLNGIYDLLEYLTDKRRM